MAIGEELENEHETAAVKWPAIIATGWQRARIIAGQFLAFIAFPARRSRRQECPRSFGLIVFP